MRQGKHPIFWEIIALGTLILGLSFLGVPMLDAVLKPSPPHGIVIRLNIVESSGFDPSVITVKRGEPVKIILHGMDVSHSLVVPDLGIDSGPVEPGNEKVVEFTPDKAGTFVFYCGTLCSVKHHFMRGTIVVEE